MNKEIEKCVNSQDMVGLRYIFADSLDVDPTFVQYREDYEYCGNLPGFWEEYEERTPFIHDQGRWNEDYWVKLKFDLGKNFSRKRFEHMMNVAKIVKAEKIERLNSGRMEQARRIEERKRELEERNRQAAEQERERKERLNVKQQKLSGEERREPERENRETVSEGSASEQQARRIEKQRRELEERNRQTAEQEREQKERLSGLTGSVNGNTSDSSYQKSRGTSAKKALGIALVVVVVIVVIKVLV